MHLLSHRLNISLEWVHQGGSGEHKLGWGPQSGHLGISFIPAFEFGWLHGTKGPLTLTDKCLHTTAACPRAALQALCSTGTAAEGPFQVPC